MRTEGSPQEITKLVGREVYSNNGVFVGEVDDVQVSVLDERSVTGLALSRLNEELFAEKISAGEGVILPYRWVQAVGDVILVSEVVERVERPAEEPEEVVAEPH